jgi:2-keto-3-deoxy-L-fuconate dehydrogenase
MAGRLKGKVAVVTAAGAGIGRAIAEAFVAEGATVYATDLNRDALEGIARAKKSKLDVLSDKAIAKFAEKVGTIDILVNAAGFVHHGTILECDDKAWDFSFDLNVKSMHRMTKAFLPGMLAKAAAKSSEVEAGSREDFAAKQATCSIVNIASGASSVRGIPNRYVYGATKAAVIGLTKALAADVIKKGVRANAICPGTIQSPSLDQRIADQAKASGQTLEAVRQAFIDRQPMGRLGRAEEIAMLAVYLASDEASYTTGQIHLVDGGFAL